MASASHPLEIQGFKSLAFIPPAAMTNGKGDKDSLIFCKYLIPNTEAGKS